MRGRSIEFSSPRSDEVTTNLHQLTSKKDGLKQLEEDLYQPLQILHAQEFARRRGRSAAPRSRPVSHPEQAREGAAGTPQELGFHESGRPGCRADRGRDPQELLSSGPNGHEKKDLAGDGAGTTSAWRTKRPAQEPPVQSARTNCSARPGNQILGRRPRPRRTTRTCPAGLKESAQALKKTVRIDRSRRPVRPRRRRAAASPILSASVPARPPRSRCWSTRSSWTITAPSWTRPGTRPWPPPNPFSLPSSGPMRLSPREADAPARPASPAPSALKGLDAQMDVLNPLLGPAGLPDVNAQALGQSRPTPALPTVEAPRVVAPTFARRR